VARVISCECITRDYIYCTCSEVEDPGWQEVVVKRGPGQREPESKQDIIDFWLREGEQCCLECLSEGGNTMMGCIDFCGANCDELTEFEVDEEEEFELF
jgi:hypothetical protein